MKEASSCRHPGHHMIINVYTWHDITAYVHVLLTLGFECEIINIYIPITSGLLVAEEVTDLLGFLWMSGLCLSNKDWVCNPCLCNTIHSLTFLEYVWEVGMDVCLHNVCKTSPTLDILIDIVVFFVKHLCNMNKEWWFCFWSFLY